MKKLKLDNKKSWQKQRENTAASGRNANKGVQKINAIYSMCNVQCAMQTVPKQEIAEITPPSRLLSQPCHLPYRGGKC